MLEPSGALDSLVEKCIRPDCLELQSILRELTGSRLPEDRVFLLSSSVVAQCLFFLQNRPIIERLSPLYATQPPSVEELVEHIHSFSLAAIRAAQ
jgi:hypothetical protein